ncbi:bifunctional DNA primase/polymerase [Deinococcus deserti]|uniref:Putative Bifunctional DNA primase/polymerase domain protein n=1 Tax=Deinococcus deserti (strain DSM 17065 / CIP 109153 / LMG 22923 / VCD115) TaxID=546414 RepID=C1D0W7_DEIDV|nr:bifunctional DNA primase/polymerase [Deinococcus deserti]ACO45491.2 putative Bifunctional DNA primase/polymerase domain protein [Deinococcus deserti VCD115]
MSTPPIKGISLTGWATGDYAQHYTDTMGFGLVPIPQGQKGPRGTGWNKPENALRDSVQAAARFGHSGENMGLLHSVSGTAVIDVDHQEYAQMALAAVGIDLVALVPQNPWRIHGQKGEKPVYLVPEGMLLPHHKLVWPCTTGGPDITVFELRSAGVQDVLPPSIHPQTQKPYVWVNGVPPSREVLPELPAELVTLWQNWHELLPVMQAACPWNKVKLAPEIKPTRHQPKTNASVIEAYNARFTPGEVLERCGYQRTGQNDWMFPGSTSGSAGVHLLPNQDLLPKVFSHHQADPLCNGHGHDAFSVFCTLEHQGNVHEAVKAAAHLLGLSLRDDRTEAESSTASADGQDTDRRMSKSTRALQLVLDAGEPWRDEHGQAYLTVQAQGRREHHRLTSRGARDYAGDLFFEKEQRILGNQALTEVLDTLAARARREGQEYPTGQRVKHWQGKVYLDLGRDDWQVVEVAGGAWRLLSAEECPVRFTRSPQMLPLPLPEDPGTLSPLSDLLNTNRRGLILCTAFLLGALSAQGPYAHLAFKGEQGVGKSTAASTLQRLVDPSTATRRRAPRKEQDLFIAARSAHVLSFDNLSSISADLSDSLCCLSTGGSFATRTLHTNDEETVLQAMRPAILNGIADLLTRADLAERTLLVELQRIEASQRLTEQELENRFVQAHPQVLGALLTALATGLQRLQDTHLEQAPRLADFAKLLVAAEPSLPWEPGEFLQVYTDMQDEAARVVLEGDDVAQALQDFLDERKWWEGPVNLLLNLLNEQEGIMAGFKRPAPDWPKSARALGERLRRLAPALSKTGYTTEFLGRRKDGLYYRMRKTEAEMFTTYTHAK